MIKKLHQIKTIAIVGAEGSGKTFLTKQLADYFQIPFTFEYGKWYCQTFYNFFYQNHQFKTDHYDFHLIAQATFNNFKKVMKISQQNQLPFCLFDTDLIFTNWFNQLQFPHCNWIEKHFLPIQPIYLFIYLKSKTFKQNQIHYYSLAQKPAFSDALLKKYQHFRPQNSKLWIIEETNYQNRFQIIVNKIKDFIND